MVNTCQEAMVLYYTSKDQCRERERTLQDAHANMRRAVQRYNRAKRRLTDAELQLGKARYIVRKSGFGSVLQVRSRLHGNRD
jgi:hypothetical protein